MELIKLLSCLVFDIPLFNKFQTYEIQTEKPSLVIPPPLYIALKRKQQIIFWS